MTTASIPNTPAEIATITPSQLTAFLQGAGVARLERGWIRVTGSDRVRWLNGMATNSVQQLTPGQANYNFFLNSQGRIQGDACIFATPDALLMETAQAATLIPYLDHYIIMDDVELTEITASRHGLTLAGPNAAPLLESFGIATGNLAELSLDETSWNGHGVTVVHSHSPLIPRFELWCDTADQASTLLDALQNAGAASIDPAALEVLRIIEGTPLFGTDIRERDLPQETNQTRALHFSKGCYLGQEIVERIRSRGSIHRTFTAFRLEGTMPATAVVLESGGKPVGELTSLASIPTGDGTSLQFALGYARREAIDRHEPFHYPGGTALPIPSPARAEIETLR
jgi:folate-binding protein YgfZ